MTTALRMLADCKLVSGVPEDLLLVNGCDRRHLAGLARSDLARRFETALARPKGLRVVRYTITPKGRKHLEGKLRG
jgi:hypothetical protein